MSNNKFEVYVASYEGDVVYVGHGALGRHKHLNSGKSHLLQANKLYFEGKSIGIVVVSLYDSKEEAKQAEIEMIEELSPLWNIDHNRCTLKDDGYTLRFTGDIISDLFYTAIREYSSVGQIINETYEDVFSKKQLRVLDQPLPLEDKTIIEEECIKQLFALIESHLVNQTIEYKVGDVLDMMLLEYYKSAFEGQCSRISLLKDRLSVVPRGLEESAVKTSHVISKVLEEMVQRRI